MSGAAPSRERKPLRRIRPDRAIGGYYRTSAGDKAGSIPLTKVEDAVVAAVRMAYNVAEEQIDRSSRLARRLRSAASAAAGGDPERKSLDAAERLVFRAMMSGLTWLEAAAAQPGSPIMRFVAAEYRLVGALLGLNAMVDGDAARPAANSEALSASLRKVVDVATSAAPEVTKGLASAVNKVVAGAAPTASGSTSHSLEIVHTAKLRRAVRVTCYELTVGEPLPTKRLQTIVFYRDAGDKTLSADLVADGKGSPRLELATPMEDGAGRWRGAICDEKGLQLGIIEIEL